VDLVAVNSSETFGIGSCIEGLFPYGGSSVATQKVLEVLRTHNASSLSFLPLRDSSVISIVGITGATRRPTSGVTDPDGPTCG
jgi:hypothetical protein